MKCYALERRLRRIRNTRPGGSLCDVFGPIMMNKFCFDPDWTGDLLQVFGITVSFIGRGGLA
jgi:hypothetical protein